MLAHVKALLFIAATTAVPSAYSLSLSSSCQASLKGLLTSQDAACLNPSAIFSFVLGNSESIPNTVNTWLNGICSSGACSNASIANVITNITSGCSNELWSAVGLNISSVQEEVINVVQQVYPTIRQVACLKDDSSGTLCAVETLSNLESVVGQLSFTDLSFFNLYADAQKLLANGVQNLACTNCIKESFSIAKANFPSIVSKAVPDAQKICGDSFVDGSSPDGISQTANTGVFSAEKSNNSGLALSQACLGRVGIVLVAIWSAFAFIG